MATLFRSASAENAELRLAFVEHLKARLSTLREDQPSTLIENESQRHEVAASGEHAPFKPLLLRSGGIPVSAQFFSRRSLLIGGTIVTTSLVTGASIEYVREQRSVQSTNKNVPILASGGHLEIDRAVPTTWLFVTTWADLGQEAVRFVAETLVGYILRETNVTLESKNPEEGKIIALSAACTHMGCLVQWNQRDRHFHCPCHNALFAENGVSVSTHYHAGLPPLPRLNTKIEQGISLCRGSVWSIRTFNGSYTPSLVVKHSLSSCVVTALRNYH